MCSAAALSKRVVGKGGAPWESLGYSGGSALTCGCCCCSSRPLRAAQPGGEAPAPSQALCGVSRGRLSRWGGIAVPPPRRLSDRRQSGGGIATETAVNLCGRIAACKYITGAQQVPRHIRPGEKMLQGEMKGSLQWNSCGISFPQEIFPPNPP